MSKNINAQALGSLGGLARARKQSKERLKEIAVEANKKRWHEHNEAKKKFIAETNPDDLW